MAAKVLFLTFHGFSPHSGISKKMLAQIEGLRQCGYEVHVCSYDFDADGNRCRLMDGEVLQNYGKGWLSALRNRTCFNSLLDWCRDNKVSAVYARSFHNAHPWTIHLFARLRKMGIPVLMEIPTYPYDNEYIGASGSMKWGFRIDRLFRHQLAKQVNAIVTFSDAERIFGAPTIRISNGVDFSALPLRKSHACNPSEVHLLAVAEVHYWHGFDRVLTGLARYYASSPTRMVHFHVVGGIAPDMMAEWQRIIEEGGLKDYVLLYGQLHGSDLDKRFDEADFAIGSLGRHRSHIDKIKTLKNREYAARGIPFVYSETDDDFEQMPYIMKAPADESPLDINRLLTFMDGLDIPSADIRQSIQHLSWTQQMRLAMQGIVR